MKPTKPLAELTDDELLDAYEIHCARHGRLREDQNQTTSLLPLRSELTKRLAGRVPPSNTVL